MEKKSGRADETDGAGKRGGLTRGKEEGKMIVERGVGWCQTK